MADQPSHSDDFLQAYDSLSDAIFRHCYFRVYDRDRAQELMQDTFMKTWEYLARGKKVDNLKAFLYRVANNLIIDSTRKKKESSLDAMQELGFEPISNTTAPDVLTEASRFVALLAKIEPMYRIPVRMRFLDDLSPKDIAIALGESENVVSVRIHRGVAQLRKLALEGVPAI